MGISNRESLNLEPIAVLAEIAFHSFETRTMPLGTDLQKQLSDSRFGRILAGGRLGFAVLTPDAKVRSHSPFEAEQEDNAVQVYLRLLLLAGDAPGSRHREQAFQFGTEYSCFVDVAHGERRAVLHLRGIPFSASDGSVESILEVVQDVTEAEAASRGETVRRTLEATIATLAHEINNPLASIVGAADLLLLLGSTQNQRAGLERILAQAKRISAVLDRIKSFLPAEMLKDAGEPRRIALDPRVATGFAR